MKRAIRMGVRTLAASGLIGGACLWACTGDDPLFPAPADGGADSGPAPDANGGTPPPPSPSDAGGDAADGGPPPTCAQTADGGTPILVASGQKTPTGIAVDGTNVYWANAGDGTIVKCPLAGCGGSAPTPLATGQSEPFSLVIDGTNIYWVNLFSTLERCPLTGCLAGATAYAGGATKATGLAIDGTNIYWTEVQTGLVASCPLGGCATPTTLYTDPSKGPTYGVAVDSARIYWVNNYTGGAFSAPLAGVPMGGAPTSLASGGGPLAYAAKDSKNLYYTQYSVGGTVLSAPLDGSLDGGAATTIASNLIHPKAILVDTLCGTLYWATTGGTLADGGADGTGAIHRCPTSGCPAQTPAVFAGAQGGPNYVAQDVDTIYWTNYDDGTVWKQHK